MQNKFRTDMPAIAGLIEIMARLRHPQDGCPWDRAQTHESIAPYTIEEAYEVAEAVKSGDADDLRDELGDLLLQVVFQARIAEEAGDFDFDAVASAISDKMRRRHPHIFGDATGGDAGADAGWEKIKAEERSARKREKGADETDGVLDGIATTLPAMLRAVKLQKRAAMVGFDWPHAEAVMDKITEETEEVRREIPGGDKSRLEDEIGDLLFAVINLARKTGIDPERALARCNDKFRTRFEAVEAAAADAGVALPDAGLERMEGWWQAAKKPPRR